MRRSSGAHRDRQLIARSIGTREGSPMTAARVLEILDALRSQGVAAAVDGGWGTDALVGRQTRPHEDLHLVVALGDVDAITSALQARRQSLLTPNDGWTLGTHTSALGPDRMSGLCSVAT